MALVYVFQPAPFLSDLDADATPDGAMKEQETMDILKIYAEAVRNWSKQAVIQPIYHASTDTTLSRQSIADLRRADKPNKPLPFGVND